MIFQLLWKKWKIELAEPCTDRTRFLVWLQFLTSKSLENLQCWDRHIHDLTVSSFTFIEICIGNSTVSRGILDKYREWYFKIHQNITSRRGGEWYLGSFEISRAGIYPKYPEETVLFPVYTTRQRNFALYVTGVIFTCKYFKFGLNTTDLGQSHFRNLSACSINE